MRAVCLSGGEIRFHSDYTTEVVDHNLIPISVIKAGICETDLQLRKGYMGFEGVLGHEFVGVAQSGRFEGQRVVGEINCSCGECDFCASGLPTHCPQRSVIGILNHDGAFADTVYVPEQNLHAVPQHVATEHAVFTEPVAAACRILEQVELDESKSVVVLGDGRLGNLCAQVLRTTGCRLTVVGKHQWKVDRLWALDIAATLLPDFQPETSSDVVVDCTGSPSGFETAMKTVRPCGTIVLKTTVAASQPVHMAPVVIDEVNIIGSRCGPFAPALELIASQQIDVQSLISAAYPLEAADRAFQHAEQPDTLKVLFDISDP